MIKHVDDRPDAFSHINDEYDYYSIRDDNGVYGFFALRQKGNVGDVHIEFTRWSHSVLKHLKKHSIQDFKMLCKSLGISQIAAKKFVDEGSDKWSRFMVHAGFSEPVAILYSYMEV